MEASYIKLSPVPASFAVAEALLSETETELSSDSLIHAYHDEVERLTFPDGRFNFFALRCDDCPLLPNFSWRYLRLERRSVICDRSDTTELSRDGTCVPNEI